VRCLPIGLLPFLALVLLLIPLASGCAGAAGGTQPSLISQTTVAEETSATTQPAIAVPSSAGTSTTSAQPMTAASTPTPASRSSTTTSTASTTTSTTTTTTEVERVIIAWQPSHQDDTGDANWHEYQICGDMVERAIAFLPMFRHVLAWETGMGLHGTNNSGGTNTPAFDSEIDKANASGADYFISVHVDGEAPSGIMGMYFTGDEASEAYAEALARAIASEVDLPHRETRGADLYSLDPSRNNATIRVLLELGDNVRNRAFLETKEGRAKMAQALANAVSAYSRSPE
jgi:hypothetical protein